MKLLKDFSRIALIAALACSFALTSCKKDDEKPSCAEIEARIESAQNAYDNDDSATNCKEYLAALKAGVSSDCYSAEDKSALQLSVTFLEAFGCE